MTVRTLKPGVSRGDDVKQAATMLHALGYFKRTPGRIYGKACQEAVLAFKKAHKLPHDRVLGSGTWKALAAAYHKKTGKKVTVTVHDGVDPKALQHVCTNLSAADAKRIAAGLTKAFRKYGITTQKRAAAAVAQFAEESAGFRTSTEYASGAEYEGRSDLGNTHAGDGVRYKGRGRIMVTGRANYAAVSKALDHDFVKHPGDLAKSPWSEMASAWWWQAHGCNQLADSGDFVGLTRRINGGTNGLATREMYWARAKQVAAKLVP